MSPECRVKVSTRDEGLYSMLDQSATGRGCLDAGRDRMPKESDRENVTMDEEGDLGYWLWFAAPNLV